MFYLVCRGFMFYLFSRGSCFIDVICIYLRVYWCPTWFPYQMMFVSLTVTRRMPHVKHDWTANPSGIHEFTPIFSGLRVAWSLIFCVMFCRSCFALWPLCCLSICGVWYLQTFFSGQPPFFLDSHLYFQILLFFRSFFWIYLSVISLLVECYLQWHLTSVDTTLEIMKMMYSSDVDYE